MAKQKAYKVMHWLNNGCYHGYIMFSCGFSYDEIISHLKRKKNAEDWLLGLSGEGERDYVNNNGNNFAMRRPIENTKTGEKKIMHYIIFKDCFEFTDWDYCKLAHEITHICQFYLTDFLDRNTEIEAEAYYHTHLMSQCLEVLRGKIK